MIVFPVRGPTWSYDSVVGSGLLDRAGQLIRDHADLKLDGLKPSSSSKPLKRCAIVSDENVARLFGERLSQSLTNAQFQPTVITIPAGEQSKTLEHAGAICDQMLAAGLDRQSFVIGLGGGVVGDISGFAAAIFQRGIPHVQIPTTVLAMVDSSIGGKTGANTRHGKNLLGAFHQPALVIADIAVLKTLPAREFNQGFAEVIKAAVIADAELFRALTNLSPSKRDGLKPSSLTDVIRRCVEIKASIVATDELDRTGERAILNFGHTVGHAIERAGEYQMFLHGEAVSLGMVAACKISMKQAGLPREQAEAIIDLLKRFDLPVSLPRNLDRAKILEALQFDKKFEDRKVRFVITPGIGSANLTSDVTVDDIREAVDAL